jgi:hypothetical protein
MSRTPCRLRTEPGRALRAQSRVIGSVPMGAWDLTHTGTLLSAGLSAELLGELERTLSAQPLAEVKLLTAFASLGRKFGSSALALTPEARGALDALGYRAPASVSRAQLARMFLLVEACARLSPAQHVALLTRAYRTASSEERVALLRVLPLLPEPPRFLPVATDACRTHVLDVFEAIACDNPYPVRHFDQASFNQLVVKALFVGAPLARVEGLRERHNPELLRMVRDYVSERRAAGRSIPSDVTLIDP